MGARLARKLFIFAWETDPCVIWVKFCLCHSYVWELEHHVELEEAVDGVEDVEDESGDAAAALNVVVVVCEVHDLQRDGEQK